VDWTSLRAGREEGKEELAIATLWNGYQMQESVEILEDSRQIEAR
jgi:hypothetical protein